MFVQLTEDNLKDIIASGEKIMVQFGTNVDPVFEQLSARRGDIKFIYADVNKYPRSKKVALVTATPTFAVFKDGRIVAQVKRPSPETLDRLLSELK